MQRVQRIGAVDPRPEDPRLAAGREVPHAGDAHRERIEPDLLQRILDSTLGAAVLLADEAHGDVQLVPVLPAGPGDPAADQREVVDDGGGQVDADEQAHALL